MLPWKQLLYRIPTTTSHWAGDRTHFARDVVEAALARAIEDKTEAGSSASLIGAAVEHLRAMGDSSA